MLKAFVLQPRSFWHPLNWGALQSRKHGDGRRGWKQMKRSHYIRWNAGWRRVRHCEMLPPCGGCCLSLASQHESRIVAWEWHEVKTPHTVWVSLWWGLKWLQWCKKVHSWSQRVKIWSYSKTKVMLSNQDMTSSSILADVWSHPISLVCIKTVCFSDISPVNVCISVFMAQIRKSEDSIFPSDLDAKQLKDSSERPLRK